MHVLKFAWQHIFNKICVGW